MNFESRVIQSSRKVHRCLLCCRDIPVGSIYVLSPYKDDADGHFEAVKMCHECAYLMNFVTRPSFKEGNFDDIHIPNFLRKIRNEYRKTPWRHGKNKTRKSKNKNENHKSRSL